ncbi:MAG: hypothetical protein SGPRY_001467 [Prymnesium sp.]
MALLLLLAGLFKSHRRLRSHKQAALAQFSSSLSDGYHTQIFTTASLPWKTGTAINALLRAASLATRGMNVTLTLPWLHPQEQAIVFPKGTTFSTPDEQESYVREWLAERDGNHAPFEIRFYPARYDLERGSILPLGDSTRWMSRSAGDLYHLGTNWREAFKLVVGVVHTNYLSYARMYQPGGVAALRRINQMVCRAYCDRLIKLSDSLQELPRSMVCNVHGVRSEFIEIGRRAAEPMHVFTEGAYFIGKILWAKGYRRLIDYLAQEVASGETPTPIAIYGPTHGDDFEQVEAAAIQANLAFRFCGGSDHADEAIQAYKTEVLSTTTAEALAMGKFVLIQRHESNAFFARFSNTLFFDTADEFLDVLRFALASTPAPLTEDEIYELSWAGATDRFCDAIALCAKQAKPQTVPDQLLASLFAFFCNGGYTGDLMRYISGGGPITRQRWLHHERRYRNGASVVEVVEKSVKHMPSPSEVQLQAISERNVRTRA